MRAVPAWGLLGATGVPALYVRIITAASCIRRVSDCLPALTCGNPPEPAQQLRQIRLAAGLTYAQMAVRKPQPGYLCNMESGRRAPPPKWPRATSPTAETTEVEMTISPPAALFQRWVRVPEEDEADVRVYRPADAPLPPARGRDGIEFRPDGSLRHYSPGPADAPVGRNGAWRAAAPDTLEISSRYGPRRYRIIRVDPGELRLRPA